MVLLTGFGPFPGAPINPAAALVRRLSRLRRPRLAGTRLAAHVFPTRYQAVDCEWPALLASLRPDIVLMVGLASRRRQISVETRACNAVSTLVPDAAGNYAAAVIAPGAPATRRFNLPAQPLARAIAMSGTPAKVSHDAGRYVCNYLSWRVLEAAGKPGGPAVAAFIHLPRPRPSGSRRGSRRPLPAQRELQRAIENALLSAIAIARVRRRMRNP